MTRAKPTADAYSTMYTIVHLTSSTYEDKAPQTFIQNQGKESGSRAFISNSEPG